jgi:hypothetical protein
MSWYARPWIAVFAYGTFALAGAVLGQGVVRWFARRRGLADDAIAAAGMRGLVVCWAALLAGTTALGAGAAYIPLWWCVGCTIAVVAWSRLTGAVRWIVMLGGFAMAAVTTSQAAQLLLTSLIPLSGALGPETPVEVVIAAVTAVTLAPFAVVLVPVLQMSSLRRVAAILAPAAGVAIGLIAMSFPYTEERPKRVYLEVHAGEPSGPRVVLETIDPGPRPEIAAQPLDAALLRPPPTIDVAPSVSPAPSGSRAVDVRLTAGGAYLVDVQLEGAIAGWSLGASSSRHLVWVGTSEPLSFRVELANQPVRVRATGYHLGSNGMLDPTLGQLPGWTVATVQTVLVTSAAL